MASNFYKFWRIKKQGFEAGETRVNMYRLRTLIGESGYMYSGYKTVKVRRNTCSDPEKYIYLKYLDSDNRYKFLQLNRLYTSSVSAESLGTVSKLSTNFATAQGKSYSLGYTASKSINASVELPNEEYEAAQGLFFSPRVYLQINETTALTDGDENWLLVTVENTGGEYVSKKNSQILSVRIQLPETNTIKM